MRKITTVVLCVLGAITVVTGNRLPSADEADEKVDAFVRSELARQRISGVELGVYREGKLTKAQGYGQANVNWNAAVTPDTIFQSGSVGKQFTATAVMMLVEEGKADWMIPSRNTFRMRPEHGTTSRCTTC
jgi:CubicO group peptidase (beta-lactamase class C family)